MNRASWACGKPSSVLTSICIMGVGIQLSDKIDFKTYIITRDKEKHFIMKKSSIRKL